MLKLRTLPPCIFGATHRGWYESGSGSYHIELLDRDHTVLGEWHEQDHDVREFADDVRLTHEHM